MPSLVGSPVTPFQAARFVVRVEGSPGVAGTAKFKTCVGLEAAVAVSEIWHGGSMIAQKEPARVTFPPVTLERGALNDAQLFNWFAITVAPTPAIGGAGQAYKRMVDIVEQDRSGLTVNRWRLVNAWVSNYKPGDFDNESDEFLIETIELTYEFFIAVGLPNANPIAQLASALG